MKTALLLFFCSLTSCFGQYRIVHGGKVYSIYDASAWVTFGNLEVETVLPHGLLCRVAIDSAITSTSVGQAGSAMRSSQSITPVRTYGQTIFLLDYRAPYALVPGSTIGPVQAVLVDMGTFTRGASQTVMDSYFGKTVFTDSEVENHPIYDVGVPYTPPIAPLTPEQKAALAKKKHKEAVKVFHWLESQATNGSVSAQTDLGEHYLTGNGTDTNLVLGKFWLQKAAEAGDVEASNKLVSLSQTNHVVVDDDK